MIRLHRLNGSEVVVNAELIDTVESHGQETVIGLVTGNRLLVKEGVTQVIELSVEYRRRVYTGAAYLPEFLKGGTPCP